MLNEKNHVYFIDDRTGGGAIILFLDITERAKAEKLRREFSANVSHELKALAAQAVESLSQKAAENGISVRVAGDRATFKANRSLVYEMLYNLIDNAEPSLRAVKHPGRISSDVMLKNQGHRAYHKLYAPS